MASRQEEKEARRKARLEQEAAEQRSAARNKRLQLMFGAVLGAGLIAAVVIFVLASGGGSKETEAKTPSQASATGASVPKVDITDMSAAAKAAGCTLANPRDEGRGHEDKTFKPSDYKTNPPTSGAHFPQWAQDGIYEPKNTPPLGQLVHTLEHGRIDVQYKPGTPERTVKQLEALLAELNSGYHMLLFQNTSWDHSLTCPTMNDKVFDAIRTFRTTYIDKGPETVA